MLDVVSSEPVSWGADVNLSFKQKHRALCAHGEARCERPAAGICRLLLLFGGNRNELLSTSNPSVPGFRPL